MSPAKTSLLAALFCMCASSVAFAQSATSLDFEIFAGKGGSFPMLANESGNAVEYALASGLVDFQIDTGVAYDNPMFCFDFSDQASAVTLRAVDANGHIVLDSLGLDSALNYDLTGGSIEFSPSAAVQCFFKGVNSETPSFGPFGRVADNQRSSNDDSGLFSDSFIAFPELNVQFQSLQVNGGDFLSFDGAAVSPGDEVAYDLVISNTGDAAADQLAFQEVFPASLSYTASLSDGAWLCDDNSTELELGYDLCPGELIDGVYTGEGALRFQDVTLPPGGQLTITVIRTVEAGSEGVIALHAGAVNGPGPTAESAVAQVDLDVLGQPTQLEFVQQPTDTTVGQLIDPPVVVEVVDASGNRVTTDNDTAVTLQLYQNGVFKDTLQTITVTNGVASFDALDTSGLEAGTGYEILAEHGVISPTVDSRVSNPFELLSP